MDEAQVGDACQQRRCGRSRPWSTKRNATAMASTLAPRGDPDRWRQGEAGDVDTAYACLGHCPRSAGSRPSSVTPRISTRPPPGTLGPQPVPLCEHPGGGCPGRRRAISGSTCWPSRQRTGRRVCAHPRRIPHPPLAGPASPCYPNRQLSFKEPTCCSRSTYGVCHARFPRAAAHREDGGHLPKTRQRPAASGEARGDSPPVRCEEPLGRARMEVLAARASYGSPGTEPGKEIPLAEIVVSTAGA